MKLTKFYKKILPQLKFLTILAALFFNSLPAFAKIDDDFLINGDSDKTAGINTLMTAVTNNDIEGVKFFSKSGKALVNQQNFGGATPLHLASRENKLEIAKILIDNGADVNLTDNEGWTPLMRASLAGAKDVVSLLLEKKASASNVNSVGESALIHATISGCSECLNLMFEKFDFINMMDTRLLKDQLTEAFVISRNQNNSATQGLVENYLERTVKARPMGAIHNDTNIIEDLKQDVKPSKVPNKIVVYSKKSPNPLPTAKPIVAPISPPKNESEVVMTVEEKGSNVVTTPPSKIQEEVFDLTGQSDEKAQNVPSIKPSVKTSKPRPRFIFKSSNPGIEISDTSEKKSSYYTQDDQGNLYKFKSGPKGKVIKRKPKPVVVVPVVPSTETPIAAPVSTTQPVAPSNVPPTAAPIAPAANPASAQPKTAPVIPAVQAAKAAKTKAVSPGAKQPIPLVQPVAAAKVPVPIPVAAKPETKAAAPAPSTNSVKAKTSTQPKTSATITNPPTKSQVPTTEAVKNVPTEGSDNDAPVYRPRGKEVIKKSVLIR